MKELPLGILLILILVVTSCLEPYQFDIDVAQDESVVINGGVTNTEGPHIITISDVNEFGLKTFTGIGGATVFIEHDGESYPMTEIEPGVHSLSKGTLVGKPGETYGTTIILAGGTTITAEETMPRPIELEDVDAQFVRLAIPQRNGREVEQQVIQVSGSTTFPETEEVLYVRMSMDETYNFPEPSCGGLHQPKICYVTLQSRSQEYALFRSDLIQSLTLRDIIVGVKTMLPETEFLARHYFSVYQHSITAEAYQYWEQVREVISQQGTVFDKPPAAVLGNFKVDGDVPVLGYFQVSSISIMRDVVLRGEYIEQTGFQPACSPFTRRIPLCCNCLQIPNSNLVRPDWF